MLRHTPAKRPGLNDRLGTAGSRGFPEQPPAGFDVGLQQAESLGQALAVSSNGMIVLVCVGDADVSERKRERTVSATDLPNIVPKSQDLSLEPKSQRRMRTSIPIQGPL